MHVPDGSLLLLRLRQWPIHRYPHTSASVSCVTYWLLLWAPASCQVGVCSPFCCLSDGGGFSNAFVCGFKLHWTVTSVFGSTPQQSLSQAASGSTVCCQSRWHGGWVWSCWWDRPELWGPRIGPEAWAWARARARCKAAWGSVFWIFHQIVISSVSCIFHTCITPCIFMRHA